MLIVSKFLPMSTSLNFKKQLVPDRMWHYVTEVDKAHCYAEALFKIKSWFKQTQPLDSIM